MPRHFKGKFKKSATVKGGKLVKLGQVVKRESDGYTFTVEAIYQENAWKMGCMVYLCGPNGMAPIPASHCERVNTKAAR